MILAIDAIVGYYYSTASLSEVFRFFTLIWGLFLIPGILSLYFALRDANKIAILIGTVFGVLAGVSSGTILGYGSFESSAAIFLIGYVMLRSPFSKITAYSGILSGILSAFLLLLNLFGVTFSDPYVIGFNTVVAIITAVWLWTAGMKLLTISS